LTGPGLHLCGRDRDGSRKNTRFPAGWEFSRGVPSDEIKDRHPRWVSGADGTFDAFSVGRFEFSRNFENIREAKEAVPQSNMFADDENDRNEWQDDRKQQLEKSLTHSLILPHNSTIEYTGH